MSSLAILLSLLWRATLFAPVFLIFYIVVVATWISRFFLPIPFTIACYTEDWLIAAAYAAAWTISILLWRSARFSGLLEKPPSLM